MRRRGHDTRREPRSIRTGTCALAVLLLLVAGACSSGGAGFEDGGEPRPDGAEAGDEASAEEGGGGEDTEAQVPADDGGLPDAGGDEYAYQDDTGSDGGPADGHGDDGAGDGGADSGGDGAASVSYCQQACGQPLDCAQQYAPWDGDNYECRDGVCVYTGCNSDDECGSVPNMEGYLCRVVAPADIALCLPPCDQPADCSMNAPAWDEDNYECRDGSCVYSGCNSDEECSSVPNMEDYVCRSQSAGGVPQCTKGCTTAADCDFGSPAYDADNYECRDGVCVYSGCNSDGECQASTPSVTTVCRPPP